MSHFLNFFAERGFRVLALQSSRSWLEPGGQTPSFVLDFGLRRRCFLDREHACTTAQIPIGHSMGGFVVPQEIFLETNDAPAGVLLASAPPRGHLRTLLRMLRRHPWRCSKFAVSGRPDHLLATTARARELFFGDKASDDLISSTAARLLTRQHAGHHDGHGGAQTRQDRPHHHTSAGARGRTRRDLSPLHCAHDGPGLRHTSRDHPGDRALDECGAEDWETVAEHIVSWLTERLDCRHRSVLALLLPSRGARFCCTTRWAAGCSAARGLQICLWLPALLSLAATFGCASRPPQTTSRLIDFAEKQDRAGRDQGGGLCRSRELRLGESRPGANFEAKPITRDYADALRAAGLQIVSNFQYGKPGWPATRRTSPAGTPAVWRTLRRLWQLHVPPAGGRVRHRSSSASMTIST